MMEYDHASSSITDTEVRLLYQHKFEDAFNGRNIEDFGVWVLSGMSGFIINTYIYICLH